MSVERTVEMHTHVAAMAFLAFGGDPSSPDSDVQTRIFQLLKSNDVRTVQQFLGLVGDDKIPRSKIVFLVEYARDPRWRTLAAEALLALDDVTLIEIEMAILRENGANAQAWRAYVARPDLTPESLQRSARQFREPWRTKAALELHYRFPGS